MVWPVLAIGVGATLLSGALVGSVVMTEESCAPSRRSFLEFAKGVLNERRARGLADGEVIASLEGDLELLQKKVDVGWTTSEEAAALGRIVASTGRGLATNAASDIGGAFAEVGQEFTNMFEVGLGWI